MPTGSLVSRHALIAARMAKGGYHHPGDTRAPQTPHWLLLGLVDLESGPWPAAHPCVNIVQMDEHYGSLRVLAPSRNRLGVCLESTLVDGAPQHVRVNVKVFFGDSRQRPPSTLQRPVTRVRIVLSQCDSNLLATALTGCDSGGFSFRCARWKYEFLVLFRHDYSSARR